MQVSVFKKLAVVAMLVAAGVASAAGPSAATPVPLLETLAPGAGGIWGISGSDLSRTQSVAQRFTVPADGNMRLTLVALWLMNNSDKQHRIVNISVQTDELDEGGTQTNPSGVVIDRWAAPVEASGWAPVEQSFSSNRLPLLKAGRSYWVVAESRSPSGVNPIWNFSESGEVVNTRGTDGVWQAAASSAALSLRVEARPIASASSAR